ncbi:benzaldehyde dehydrogenase [Streptomyces flavofungini]|uniref:Benzaldehyde dehydrogenase n=1 Tax=Streptomyces flavofungini TaxID=68200 RepID=A0ABS0X4E7_9ACTN|nr:benzaldehyde dehydrogenase [Streptomyces flavofungini]MBJ3808058.1 benzaldehyde dehydrogenase [Streptomyces flavofungini]
MSLFDPALWSGKINIDGWRDASGGKTAVVNPSTGDTLEHIGSADASDIARAASRAAEVQRAWAATPNTERAAILRRAGELFAAHAPQIQDWLIRESGSTRARAVFETDQAEQECYEAAVLCSHPIGQVMPSAEPRLSMTRRVPAGVVGVISPFNVPLILAIRSVAPALALGNTVVLKPDPRTAVSGGVTIMRIFEEAGLPQGVLTLVPGDGAAGAALVDDPHVRVISFTGSTGAGRKVGEAAARGVKRAHLELGGNNPMIVLADADLDRAISTVAWGSFFNQGQVCMATGRILVHADIAEEFTARLVAKAEQLTVGDPDTADVDLGPLINAHQRDTIHAQVTASIAAGARLLAGGTYDDLFYRPTVLVDVPDDAPAYAEEVFGPVVPVRTFTTLDEAAQLAADDPYGLSLGILTRDVMTGLELAERIPSGLVHINDQTINDDARIPFGGVGWSGTGARFGGEANIDAFTETRWITVRSSQPVYPI